MKKIEELTKKELIEKNNELMKMLEDSLHKLINIGVKLCDATIEKCKLLIEIEELKEKLKKYETSNS